MHQNCTNAPKHEFLSNGVDRVRSLRKIPMRLRATNFCTSSARFAPSFVSQPNGPKCTKIVQNAPKHEFRVQWGGLGALVAKNSDATSWHELLLQFGPFCTEFRKSTKRSQMHQNCTKCSKTCVEGQRQRAGGVRLEKFEQRVVARPFVSVLSSLHQVSEVNQTVPIAPKFTKCTRT